MNPEAYFHRIVDCLIPEYQFLKSSLLQASLGNSSCLVGQGSRYAYFEALNGVATLNSRDMPLSHAKKLKCIDRVEDQVVLNQVFCLKGTK